MTFKSLPFRECLSNYIKANSLGRFGQDERDFKTSLAYMSDGIADVIDPGMANSMGACLMSSSKQKWLSDNAEFVTALNNAGLYCGFRTDDTTAVSTRKMFGNSVELYYIKQVI